MLSTLSAPRGLFLWLLSQLHACRPSLSSTALQSRYSLGERNPPTPNCDTYRESVLHTLMAILYQHMAMQRVDFILLFSMLYRSPVPSTKISEHSALQCLLCIESMALWHVVNQPVQQNASNFRGNSSLRQHPFFWGLADVAEDGPLELDTILHLLRSANTSFSPNVSDTIFLRFTAACGSLRCPGGYRGGG